MGCVWASLILLCTRAARHEHTKIAGMVDGKPSYIDPALIPLELDADPEGGETEDAGYQQ